MPVPVPEETFDDASQVTSDDPDYGNARDCPYRCQQHGEGQTEPHSGGECTKVANHHGSHYCKIHGIF
jgi:hypothetical protein